MSDILRKFNSLNLNLFATVKIKRCFCKITKFVCCIGGVSMNYVKKITFYFCCCCCCCYVCWLLWECWRDWKKPKYDKSDVEAQRLLPEEENNAPSSGDQVDTSVGSEDNERTVPLGPRSLDLEYLHGKPVISKRHYKSLEYREPDTSSTVSALDATSVEIAEFQRRMNEFNGTLRELEIFERVVTKVLLKLDKIESHGKAELRARRKELVIRIKAILKQIDERKIKLDENGEPDVVPSSDFE